MRSTIVVCILTLLCFSCTDTFEMRHSGGDAKLVVYAFPTSKDTFDIHISASIPTSGNQDAELRLEHVTVTTNGMPDKVIYKGTVMVGDLLNKHAVECFQAIGKHQSGDTIEVCVTDRDLPSARGRTVLTSGSVWDSIEPSWLNYKGSQRKLYLSSFHPTPSSSYYAVRMLHLGSAEVGADDLNMRQGAIFPELEPLFQTKQGFGEPNHYYRGMYLLDLSDYSDAIAQLRLVCDSYGNHATKVVLYTLSSEYMNLLKSINSCNDNDMADYGLSFISTSYSNVEGGLGCIGSYEAIESPWLK